MVNAYLNGTDCFLVDIRLSPGKLGVAIDTPSGVTLDECTALTRFLLNHFGPTGFLESHEVEVGSPGMDAPLVVPQQYQRRIGKELRIVLTDGKEVKGILQEVYPDGIQVKETLTRKENKKKVTTEVVHQIPFSGVKEAKLIINYKFK